MDARSEEERKRIQKLRASYTYIPGAKRSPYEGRFNIEALEADAKRLSHLPSSIEPVNRWRRQQVWLIGYRIREVERIADAIYKAHVNDNPLNTYDISQKYNVPHGFVLWVFGMLQ